MTSENETEDVAMALVMWEVTSSKYESLNNSTTQVPLLSVNK